MNVRMMLFIPLLIFAVLVGFFWRGLSLDPNAMPSELVDKSVPAFSLSTLAVPEQQVTQADLEGPLLLNVWATWCISCRHEHPYLVELASKGVKIYGINYKDDVSKARAWLQELGDPYVFNIVDGDGRLGIDLGVFGAPETYLVDQQGVIRYKHVGVVDQKVWSEVLEPLYRQYQ